VFIPTPQFGSVDHIKSLEGKRAKWQQPLQDNHDKSESKFRSTMTLRVLGPTQILGMDFNCSLYKGNWKTTRKAEKQATKSSVANK